MDRFRCGSAAMVEKSSKVSFERGVNDIVILDAEHVNGLQT
eukprot:XP_001708059.1 Hypothetical protein GL50803_38303 [Giardia lamblia ATCC 50803]